MGSEIQECSERFGSAGKIELWDPLAGFGSARNAVWPALALGLLLIQWPMLVKSVTIPPQRDFLPDFFQEYASCKNAFHGLPVYSEQELTSRLYLEAKPGADNLVVHVNAHPPGAVLLALPFIWLDFESAFVAWNVFSLALLVYSIRLVLRELGIGFGPACYAPALALAVTCYPILGHLVHGQLNLILSTLLLGAWACDRNERPWAAGLLIGLAVTIKLFPLFLLAFFAWGRRWNVVVAGLMSAFLTTAMPVCILGKQAYVDYLFVVLPRVGWFRVAWNNISLLGFFSRLFDPLPNHPDNLWWHTRALVQSKALMILGFILAVVSLVSSFAWATFRLEDRTQRDLGFGLAMICMVLLSPVAWEHYLVLLILPLALAWADLPLAGALIRKTVFLVVVALFWTSPNVVYRRAGMFGRTATPSEVILFLSTQFYALIGLYGLCVDSMMRHRRSRQALED